MAMRILTQTARRQWASLIRPTLFGSASRSLVNATPVLQKDYPYHLVVGLPALSPTMEAGALSEWYLKEGESFAAGDAVASIETDKATMDFEAQDDGFVAKILMAAGDGADIPVGTPIMITVEEEGDISAFADYQPPAVEAPPAPAVQEAAAAPTPPPPVAAPTPPPAAAPTPAPPAAPVAAAPAAAAPAAAPAAAAAAAPAPSTFNPNGPLAKTMAAKQSSYVELYGTTGQRPIL